MRVRGRLVRAGSSFMSARGVSVCTERVLVARSLFVRARGVSVVHAERVLITRSSFVSVSVLPEKVLVTRSSPIPIGGRSELIVVLVIDQMHVHENVCVFLWCCDNDE